MGQVPPVIPLRTLENAEIHDRVLMSLVISPPRGRTLLMLLRQLRVCRKQGHDWMVVVFEHARGRKCRRCFKGGWA